MLLLLPVGPALGNARLELRPPSPPPNMFSVPISSPSPPAEGGEGWGEEGRFSWNSPLPDPLPTRSSRGEGVGALGGWCHAPVWQQPVWQELTLRLKSW
jgi:hypothetical protein